MDTHDYYVPIIYKSLIINDNEMNFILYKITLWFGVIFNTMKTYKYIWKVLYRCLQQVFIVFT